MFSVVVIVKGKSLTKSEKCHITDFRMTQTSIATVCFLLDFSTVAAQKHVNNNTWNHEINHAVMTPNVNAHTKHQIVFTDKYSGKSVDQAHWTFKSLVNM